MTGIAVRASLWPERRRWLGDLTVGLAVTAAALLTAYAVHAEDPVLALAIAVLPLAIWEATRLSASLVLLGASLPALQSIAGGSASLNVAVSDLLLVFIGAAILAQAVVTRAAPELRALRPVSLPFIQYGLVTVLLIFVHPGLNAVLQTAQRLELFVIPLIVGAFAALTNRYVHVLRAYVLAATLLAAIWPVEDFAMQKNPVGQMIGNAILLLVAFPRLRSFLPCLLVLVPGLFLTESRGAVAATVIGLAGLVLIRESRARALLTRAVPLVIIGVAAFTLLPAAGQERLTTFSSDPQRGGSQTPGEYAIDIRQRYFEDAQHVIAAQPWTGVGVGNYLAGDPYARTLTDDPHQVLLLQAAEGGYFYAGSFLLLIFGSGFALYRMRRIEIAPAAAAVFIATVVHGFADIYWVRGTPVLGWLLVGIACGLQARNAPTTRKL